MKKIRNILLIILTTTMLLTGCSTKSPINPPLEPVVENPIEEPGTVTNLLTGEPMPTKEELLQDETIKIEFPPEDATEESSEETQLIGSTEFHFIDVGQADSILIITPNRKSILVDTGVTRAGTPIINKLNAEGVTEIDLLVATHPHADHIGGMQSIVSQYDTKEIMMSSYIATTKTFENLLDEIANQGKSITQAKPGLVRNIDGVELEVLGVDTLPKDANNSSIVIKVTYGETDLILTGDAESKVEQIILNEYGDKLDAEILKLGHHGSDTSTSDNFLDAVDPDIAVISVGTNNKYGHPSQSILTKLTDKLITTYRTDLNGTVTIKTDGTDIEVTTDK